MCSFLFLSFFEKYVRVLGLYKNAPFQLLINSRQRRMKLKRLFKFSIVVTVRFQIFFFINVFPSN